MAAAPAPPESAEAPAEPPSPPRLNWRVWGASVLSDVLDRAGLGEPAAPMLDWIAGGAGAAVPGAERFARRPDLCLICFDAVPTFASGTCDHGLCTTCAVAYVRGALGDAQAQVHAAGVRCPLHSSGCAGCISSTDAARLLSARNALKLQAEAVRGRPVVVSEGHSPALGARLARWSQRHVVPRLRHALASATARLALPPAGALPEDALTIEEVERLQRFIVEASIPAEQRTWCPRCRLLVILPEPKAAVRARMAAEEAAAAAAAAPGVLRRLCSRARGALSAVRAATRPAAAAAEWVVCPHCTHRWDQLRDVEDPRAAAGDRTFDERASAALIELTSKKCPNPRCSQRITHWQGHACHHIAPATNGCPACHLHFCYVCLRPHGTPGGGYRRNPLCRHGSSFCSNANIEQHLVMRPYPHDRRCGCQICSLCRPGRPCEQCSGHCVVCTGAVQPGPSVVSAAALADLERTRPWRWTWRPPGCSCCCSAWSAVRTACDALVWRCISQAVRRTLRIRSRQPAA